MIGDFLLRPAVNADLRQLQSISAEARARYTAIPSLAHIVDSPALDSMRFEPCRIVVAVDAHEDAIVGFAMTRPLDEFLYLDNISVGSIHSGRGIGADLLLETVAYAEELEAQAVTLTTFRAPPWNGPWFRRYGFQVMPPNRIGKGLADVVERQSQKFDPQTRETLWRPL